MENRRYKSINQRKFRGYTEEVTVSILKGRECSSIMCVSVVFWDIWMNIKIICYLHSSNFN
jgi:hypothetical protein